jgi:multidrug resistance efflux pump
VTPGLPPGIDATQISKQTRKGEAMWKSFLLPVLSVGMLTLASYHIARTSRAEPRLPPPSPPARAPYGATIGASGVIEPRTENISLGSPVPGMVEEVFVRVGEKVAKGRPLFRLDDRQWRAELRVREAMLAASEAQLERLVKMPRSEEIPPSQAKIDEAQANVARVGDLVDRGRRLLANKVITAEEMVSREQNWQMVRQQLAKAEAEHKLLLAGAWEPDKLVARVAVEQARAEVARVRTELDRLVVNASVDGEILQVNVRPGEYVNQTNSKALIVLGNVEQLHVRVDIDEQDIPRFATESPAEAFLRSDSRRAYPLTFVRVEPFVVPKKSLTGDVTERVDTRVLQVIYALDQQGDRVFVGQQMDVFLKLAKEPVSGGAPTDRAPGRELAKGDSAAAPAVDNTVDNTVDDAGR